MAIEHLTGQADDHLVALYPDCLVHREVLEPWQALARRATEAGFDLRVASGFRSFARQLAIWNAKARGLRALLDDRGRPLDAAKLSARETMLAILRWSALPGTSRHHWGTDMDVWDAAAVPGDYRLQLTPAEWAPGGPFHPLHLWLTERIAAGDIDFYRPYAEDGNGVAPEAWHLSYRPLAELCAARLTPAVVRPVLENADIALKTVILADLEDILARFVGVPTPA